jgi:hypothetical protein
MEQAALWKRFALTQHGTGLRIVTLQLSTTSQDRARISQAAGKDKNPLDTLLSPLLKVLRHDSDLLSSPGVCLFIFLGLQGNGAVRRHVLWWPVTLL